jgi:serine/threonine protein kinase
MKAANLLINNRGQLQIADFGLARPFHDPGRAWDTKGWNGGLIGYTSMVVTRWYRPPELLAGDRKYGPPIDMWGLGCILAEMVNRKPIFKGSSEIDQLILISQICGSPNEGSYPGWNSLPGVKDADSKEPDVPGRHDFGNHPRKVIQYFTVEPLSVRRELADLIDKLLVLDPCKRLTAKEALEHEWFWQTPYPADPNSLPAYQASKELDRQRRDQQKYQQQQQQHQQQQQRAAQAQYQQQQQQAKSMTGHANNNFRPRHSNGSHPDHNGGKYHYGSRPIPTGPSGMHRSQGHGRPAPMGMMNSGRPHYNQPGGHPQHHGQSQQPPSDTFNPYDLQY